MRPIILGYLCPTIMMEISKFQEPLDLTYHLTVFFVLIKTMEISKFHFRTTMVQGGNFSTTKMSFFMEPMKGDC